ncbi:probable endoglucanase E1 [Coccomyxa sp. Obi]|nr:probable endoglucanase E1 [Coccomyxa sp. Obi]
MVTMRLCLLVLATAASTHAALAADVSSEGYNAAGITSSNYPGQISKGQRAVIDSVRQALGSSDITSPKLDSNPNPPVESPPIKVPATVTAEWHNIARPAGATCAVALKPYLIYSDAYEYISPDFTKEPTAAQVPTSYRGAVDLTLFSAGGTIEAPYTITVASKMYNEILNVVNAEAVGNSTNGTATFEVTSTDFNLLADFSNMVNVTYFIDAKSQALAPTSVAVNGQLCSVQLNITLSNNVPPTTDTPASDAAIEQSTVPISVVNGQFFGTNGQPTTMKGVNWFGFETSATMVAGLWQGPTAMTQDFGIVLYRIQLLGFNTIRVPFSFQILYNTQPSSYTAACTPVTNVQVGQSVVPPGTNIPTNAQPPPQAAPTGGNSGTCNALVPNDSGYKRFLWVIKAMVDNGFMVLIDNHLNLDSTAVDNPTAWVNYWKSLMTGIVGMGQKYQNAVMVDILNEPDSRGLNWQSTGTLYIAAMDAISQVSPSTLYYIEGCGQLAYAMCWGDGFVTDPYLIQNFGLTDPRPFLNTLQTKSYKNQVVISPHYYPPSISGQSFNYTGVGLFTRMQNSFGHLTAGQGYNGQVFALAFGETGSFYTSATDIAMLADMARYMRNDYSSLGSGYSAANFPHANLPNLYWWDWNANSGDTGGIVQNDWLTIIWSKVNWLIGAINLTPWYLTYNGNPTPPPPTSPPPAPTPTPTPPTPSPTPPANPTPTPTQTAQPTPSPSPTPTPTPKPTASPSPTPTPTPTPTKAPSPTPTPTMAPTPPPATGACTITYQLQTVWPTQSSAPFANTINLALTNGGAGTITVPYTLAIYNPSYALITGQAWNWGASGAANAGVISGAITQAWENLPAGGTVGGIGANIWATTNNMAPTAGSINGIPCTIKSG